MYQRVSLLLSFMILVCCGVASAQLPLASQMPDFKFYRLSDSTVFTKDNIEKGKKCLVMFVDASCSHCQEETQAIGKQYSDFKDVNIYMVTMDERRDMKRFMNTYGKELSDKKNVTVLLDPDKQFVPTFMPIRFPGLYVYSVDKKLTWHIDGQRDLKELIEAIR